MVTKTFYAFIVLILIAISANATDVLISNTTIPGIQPAGLGSSRALTGITTTNESTAITCSSCFPAATVGLQGFTIAINSVDYNDITITSTSTATLGIPYLAASGTYSGVFYPYILLRWYASAAFQPNSATYVVQPGTVGTNQYFRQYAASVIAGTASIKSMTIPATTDATMNARARWVMGMYLPSGSPINVLICPTQVTQWQIAPYTPTTLVAICQYNYPPAIVPPNNESYTKPQIDYRFPACTAGQSVFYQVNGNRQQCLKYGDGLVLTGDTLASLSAGMPYSASVGTTFSVSQSYALYTMPGNVVTRDNDWIQVFATGEFSSAGTKNWGFTVGSTQIANTGNVTTSTSPFRWELHADCKRNSSTLIGCTAYFLIFNGTGLSQILGYGAAVVPVNFASSIAFTLDMAFVDSSTITLNDVRALKYTAP